MVIQYDGHTIYPRGGPSAGVGPPAGGPATEEMYGVALLRGATLQMDTRAGVTKVTSAGRASRRAM